ncbi:DUF554 domain-containing protein [Desulfobacter sp.]|jgi:uncharacterized membrane protein YqgA involved in biofilm formation|uniref:DUF554 domain-containing protein n=1 Tax=Desulfobacter sp. TaxID=2294 RepID=UPI000E8C35F5|nr:DUF554 domain-containing protein [Desulfobacter sp.]HBT88024.1 hypothetical protein [Desulfobacter sp.]
MIGPFVNGAAIIVGGVSGAVLGERVSKNLRHKMPMIFGCASMGLGIAMVVKVTFLPVAILSLLLGSIMGELIHLEAGIEKVAGIVPRMMDKVVTPPKNGLSQEEYMEKFIAILVLFCASGTGVFGAIKEGMTGDASLLIVKAFLDLFTAGIFAIALGFPVATLAIPQFIIQTGLFLGAATIIPLTSPAMIADFSAVGGLIMFATGFQICGIVSFPIANMLPSLLIAMPISALWVQYFVH